MKKAKTYQITQETQDIYLEYNAYNKVKDDYLCLRWVSHRLVVRCAVKCEKLLNKFWDSVYEEHPILKGKNLSYNSKDRFVKIIR